MKESINYPKLICFDVVMVGAPPPFHQRPEFYAMDEDGNIYLYEETTNRWVRKHRGWF